MIRLRQIDGSNIGEHAHLTSNDKCYYLREHTSGGNYKTSETNSLISNLKKKPCEQNTKPGFHYKQQAIRACSDALRQSLSPVWLRDATLVPIPGSKILGDPDHDDRMERVCKGIAEGLDVRPLVVLTTSTDRAHEAGPGGRPVIDSLLKVYKIEESLATPPPTQIGIVDDVLTTGCHSKAMQAVLGKRFVGAHIFGIFIARRIFPKCGTPRARIQGRPAPCRFRVQSAPLGQYA